MPETAEAILTTLELPAVRIGAAISILAGAWAWLRATDHFGGDETRSVAEGIGLLIFAAGVVAPLTPLMVHAFQMQPP